MPILKNALQPIIHLLDRSKKEQAERPTALQEGTRFPRSPWDLRTVIIVFPKDSGFRYLNLNTTLGLTGVPFDQVKNISGLEPADCFDLQFCLQAEDGYTSYKKYHSVCRDISYTPGKVHLELAGRLFYQGEWPAYSILFHHPEEELSVKMELDSWQGFQWWFYAPALYCHNTTFAYARLEVEQHGERIAMTTPALHDHGWGRNLLPLRPGVGVFRYEVMRFGESGHAISLWSEAPLGLRLKNIGLVRPDEKNLFYPAGYNCDVLEWEEHQNYAGCTVRVPAKWRGFQEGKALSFTYEALRSTEPLPLLGEGLIYGFDYQGRLTGAMDKRIKGRGYVEQLGLSGRGK